MSTVKIAIIGGDSRQGVLAAELAKKGFECAAFGLDGISIGEAVRGADLAGTLKGATAAVLPLPVSRDGATLNAPNAPNAISFSDVEKYAEESTLIIGGMIDEKCFPTHKVRDYYVREDLILYNTLPTAEGALAIAMSELPTTIHGTKTLVMGFGRVGKSLCMLLKGFGADMVVATRNQTEIAVCEILGLKHIEYSQLEHQISEFGLIFNTVPAVILTAELLEKINDGVPVIDLATHPGGVDAEAAKKLGKNLIWALSLPGKVAPVTAGLYIEKAVSGILKEEGIVQ